MVSEKISIHAAGTNLLSEAEMKKVNDLLESYYNKIQRHFDEPVFLDLHIKEYNKEGTRKKYSLNVFMRGAGKKLEASYADWDLAKTIHKVMEKLLGEIEHQFRVSEKRKGK
ncbi:MAG: hypothetical protein RL557_877 [archaeon]|jgi:ribosome-associated translation inhibitor RaiA